MTTTEKFNIIILKPNICTEQITSNHFQENVFKLLNHEGTHTYDNLQQMNLILTQYLSKRDYISNKIVTLETLCKSFEQYVNPNDELGHRYEVKTCLNNDEEIIMFLYDYSMNRYPNTFNHLATILSPAMESVFGPVFMTKIKKVRTNNVESLKHVDLTIADIVDLWFSTKQITYWNYEPTNGWTLLNMFNNNVGLDTKKYSFSHINENIVFFQLNNDVVLEDSLINILNEFSN
jgi:hypothetical protein